LYDFHIHSCFSYDGKLPIPSLVSEAEEKGLSGICFTDHMEMAHTMPQWATPLDIPAYRQAFEEARSSSTISLFMGMELGMQPGFAQQADAIIKGNKFDFVIASMHLFKGMDPYYEDLSLKMDRGEIIELMVSETLDSLSDLESFSVLGHLDYIFKHHPEHPQALGHDEAPGRVDELLKFLISRGKGIEVNTSAYDYTGTTMPSQSIVQRYRELGGEIVTLGSDTHRAGMVGGRFEDALGMLWASGFRYYTYFQDMEPRFLPIR
jgi:histidinol-phosphatase (PHP family)